jgi:hypothetical protein
VARLSALTGRARRSGVGSTLPPGRLRGRRGHAAAGSTGACRRPWRAAEPKDWRVGALPPTEARISGEAEEEAFRRLRPADEGTVDRIARAVLTGLLPALVERDLPAFGKALSVTQELVGACFAPVQEGVFHPAASALVRALKKGGACGVGQSSWGPAVRPSRWRRRESASWVGARRRIRVPRFSPARAIVARCERRADRERLHDHLRLPGSGGCGGAEKRRFKASTMQVPRSRIPWPISRIVSRSSFAGSTPTSRQPCSSGVSFSQLWKSRPQGLCRMASMPFRP